MWHTSGRLKPMGKTAESSGDGEHCARALGDPAMDVGASGGGLRLSHPCGRRVGVRAPHHCGQTLE
ncbi:hypothetical protein BIWAKO_02086 [Bosea sp. BIWAKO-01]|nr:hypothetical protein BIWAKO_02086 [Bosea sp. BIWAKO-01]